MMFLRPIESMTLIDSASAPAPIDSIEMTAPTPKMIPSIVRSVRSLWRKRMRTAVRRFSPSCIGRLPDLREAWDRGLSRLPRGAACRGRASRPARPGDLRIPRVTDQDALSFGEPRGDRHADQIAETELHVPPFR